MEDQPVIANKQTIEQIFDGAASIYDRAGPHPFRNWGDRLVERMNLPSGARVLDVGTGTGAVLLPAAKRVGPRGQVVGIDISRAILGEAAHAASGAALHNVILSQMDAERIALPDGAFDAVTCAFALFLFPDLTGALREMARVCRPGGQIGLTLFSRSSPPFDPGWPILYQQLSAYKASVRMPNRVAYLPEELHDVLTKSGLAPFEIAEQTSEWIYSSEEDWWTFQLTVGSRAAILGMAPATRARFRDEYFARLRPLFKADGLHLTVSVLYALVRL